MTAVNDAILDDLLNPGFVIGKRVRVRTDGTHLYKVHVNEASQKILNDRTELIQNLYKVLTNRKLAIEFKAEASYFKAP